MKKENITNRINPLIDRYVTTDLSLLKIIRNAPSINNPCTHALLLISECLAGERLAKDAISAAEAAPLQNADSELQCLLMSQWAELSCRIGRPNEAKALLHQAKSKISDKIHPVIRVATMQAESILADTTGNQNLRESILRNILTIIDENSPRRKFHLWELALLLAAQGRGSELTSQMRELTWQCNENFPLARLHIIQFINAVETGNIHEASTLMPEIATSIAIPTPQKALYKQHQTLLALMHNASTARLSPRDEKQQKTGTDLIHPSTNQPQSSRDSISPRRVGVSLAGLAGASRHAGKSSSSQEEYPNPKLLPTWAQVISHLLANNNEKALKTAQLEAKRKLSSIFQTGFSALNLVRAELSCQHHEAAQRLLTMRHARGNKHYLDDFFIARAELLAGNKPEAQRAFAKALEAVDQYDAKGRLNFELKLATELSQSDIITLSKRPRTGAGSARPSPRQSTNPPTLQPPTPIKTALQNMLGRSAAIQDIRETIKQYAPLDAPVIITGETGTGKDIIARALHEESNRNKKPFVAINCGTIAESLLESELFGHEKGSFTGADRYNKGLFEEANAGTIFLDEIGEISPRLQVALLRVLETGEIRAIGSTRTRTIQCRIMAATHANLHQRIEQGLFRQDLMYRLERLRIHVPPLRERPDDIMLLVRHFIDIGREIGTHSKVNKAFVQAVKQYEWPGNVRELRNVIERMRLTHSDKLSYTEKDLDIRRNWELGDGSWEPKDTEKDNIEHRTPKPHNLSPHPRAGEAIRGINPQNPDTQNPEPRPSTISPATMRSFGAGTPSTNLESFLKSGTSQLRRNNRLRELFQQYKHLTRSEIIHILAVSPNTATKYLKALCEEDFIKRIEPTPSTRTHYFELVPNPNDQTT